MDIFPFPINRRHQGLATVLGTGSPGQVPRCFQSMGVTCDWRPPTADPATGALRPVSNQ